jgi:hypothetical protein
LPHDIARWRRAAVSTEQDDYLARVKDEIRKEADLARHRNPLPRHDPPPRAVPPPSSGDTGIERDRLDYSLSDLTGANYIAFVDGAFRALLKREPDEGGSHAQINLLASGASKAEILGNLRWSREGKHVGVRVRGLLPRYAMAKLARVPVVGYFVEWTIAFAGLPMLLRHQRATDTSTAARFNTASDIQARNERELSELRAADASLDAARLALKAEHDIILAAQAGRSAELAGEIRRIQLRVDDLERRAAALHGTVGTIDQRAQTSANELVGLRHLVHTVNHWVASLQRSLEDLESVESAARERTDAIAAGMVEAPDAASARQSRYADWAAAFAERLPERASVLDLASGDGVWLEALGARGIDASGVEANLALVERARVHRDVLAPGDPLASLGRCADEALDGITLGRDIWPDDDIGMERLIGEIARVLKPGGLLLARMEPEPYRIVSRDVSADDARRWSAAVEAAGFAPARLLSAIGGIALLTHRP